MNRQRWTSGPQAGELRVWSCFPKNSELPTAGMLDGMSTSSILASLDAEILRLQQARALLSGTEESAPRRRCRRVQRMGNWLTREQAKELLQVPDRTLIGKRDYALLALLTG